MTTKQFAFAWFAVVFLNVFCLVGCGSWDKAKKAVGLGETAPAEMSPEEVEAQKQVAVEAAKKEQEEAARKAEEEKRRAAEAKRLSDEEAERLARAAFLHLTTAQDAVPKIAASLKGPSLDHGELPLDPWGNLYTVEYHQEWTDRIATVRSNGPDGKKDTADDITATRKISYVSGTLSGLGAAGWAAILWIVSALVCFLMLPMFARYRQNRNMSHKIVNLNLFLFLVAATGPIMLLVYFTTVADGHYGFDWQFE